MSRWLKRVGVALGTLVVLIVVFAGFVMAKSSSLMTKKYPVVVAPIEVRTDSTSMARGEHLTTVIAKCVECHGSDLGGKTFIDDPALGLIVAPNLTAGAGGIAGKYSDAQLAALIRTGVKRDSTSTIIMPSDVYQWLTDDDVAAIVAYVRAQPPVNRTHPASFLRPVGRALAATGKLPVFTADGVSPTRTHEKSVTPDSTVAYGSYLANVGGCTGCHGPGLSGGKIAGTPPDWPPAANISPTGLGKYTDAQVRDILLTGNRPDGTKVNAVMPWEFTRLMTPLELTATIKYLRTVPPKEFGHH
jgi:cytochrome c553